MATKAEKAKYDREYRKKNHARMAILKAAYFQRTYDPIKAAVERKKTMPRHVEYCRQPEYKAWKKKYDKQHRAARYGGFAEAYELLKLLDAEIRRQEPDRFERYKQSARKQWNPITRQIRRRKSIWNF